MYSFQRIALTGVVTFFLIGGASTALAQKDSPYSDKPESSSGSDVDSSQTPSDDSAIDDRSEPAGDSPADSGDVADDAEQPPYDESPVEDNGQPPSLSEPLTGAEAPATGGALTTVPPGLAGITTVPVKPLNPVSGEDEGTDTASLNQDTGIPPIDEGSGEASLSADTAVTAPVTQPPPPVSTYADDEEQKFAPISFSPQIGYAYFPESDYEVKGLKFSVDNRNSFVLKLHFDLGGDGLAFELVPLLAYQKIGGDISSFGSDLSGGVAGSLLAVGGQFNLMVRGSWGSFFPHLGIGFYGAYLYGDGIEYGADIYGRLPVGFTWYVAKHLGIVVEFAFMIGATGIRKKAPDTNELYDSLQSEYGISQDDVESIDWENQDWQSAAGREQIAADLGITGTADMTAEETVNRMIEDQLSRQIKFGVGYAFEFMVGFRFP
jgi:hypothetical protein